jgi:hypothetical protein
LGYDLQDYDHVVQDLGLVNYDDDVQGYDYHGYDEQGYGSPNCGDDVPD